MMCVVCPYRLKFFGKEVGVAVAGSYVREHAKYRKILSDTEKTLSKALQRTDYRSALDKIHAFNVKAASSGTPRLDVFVMSEQYIVTVFGERVGQLLVDHLYRHDSESRVSAFRALINRRNLMFDRVFGRQHGRSVRQAVRKALQSKPYAYIWTTFYNLDAEQVGILLRKAKPKITNQQIGQIGTFSLKAFPRFHIRINAY